MRSDIQTDADVIRLACRDTRVTIAET